MNFEYLMYKTFYQINEGFINTTFIAVNTVRKVSSRRKDIVF